MDLALFVAVDSELRSYGNGTPLSGRSSGDWR
jgi:hypothetical protein